MKATKVKLRKREYANGTVTLYLDFYPPIRDPRTMKPTRREYLGMSIIKDPRTPAERRINDQKLKQAEAIRAQRELSIINEQYGFLDKTKYKMDVIEYFQDIVLGKDQKWGIVLEHFKKFSHGTCTFSELTIEFCNAFRDYLSTANRLNSATLKISPNSAASYWSTFRAFLAIAVKEGYISENINNHLDKLQTKDTKREFLTIDELRRLYDTPCNYPVLRAASIFSCLTGLRISDILQLEWKHIQDYPTGGKCVRIKTEKTDTEATIPISNEALELCGTPSSGIVFKGLSRTMVYHHLPKWIAAAGITKKITFHCFRHTNATLMLAGGADFYTVSKMLTHKNVSTTQIYANLVNEKGREAAEIIKIKEEK